MSDALAREPVVLMLSGEPMTPERLDAFLAGWYERHGPEGNLGWYTRVDEKIIGYKCRHERHRGCSGEVISPHGYSLCDCECHQ